MADIKSDMGNDTLSPGESSMMSQAALQQP